MFDSFPLLTVAAYGIIPYHEEIQRESLPSDWDSPCTPYSAALMWSDLWLCWRGNYLCAPQETKLRAMSERVRIALLSNHHLRHHHLAILEFYELRLQLFEGVLGQTLKKMDSCAQTWTNLCLICSHPWFDSKVKFNTKKRKQISYQKIYFYLVGSRECKINLNVCYIIGLLTKKYWLKFSIKNLFPPPTVLRFSARVPWASNVDLTRRDGKSIHDANS